MVTVEMKTFPYLRNICGTLDGLGSKVDVRENEEVSGMNQVFALCNNINVAPYTARRKVWGKDQVCNWKC